MARKITKVTITAVNEYGEEEFYELQDNTFVSKLRDGGSYTLPVFNVIDAAKNWHDFERGTLEEALDLFSYLSGFEIKDMR